jgi:hypothetical protein
MQFFVRALLADWRICARHLKFGHMIVEAASLVTVSASMFLPVLLAHVSISVWSGSNGS